MKTTNLRVHNEELKGKMSEMRLFENLPMSPDLPFLISFFTDEYNQRLCSGDQTVNL